MAIEYSPPYSVFQGKTCSIAMHYMAEVMKKAEQEKSLFAPAFAKKMVPGEAKFNYLLNNSAFHVVSEKAKRGAFKAGDKVGSWLGEDSQLVDIIYGGTSNLGSEAGGKWILRDNATKQTLNHYNSDHDMLSEFVQGQGKEWTPKKKPGNIRWGIESRTKPPAVNPLSSSPGALTDVDAATLFVKTKDEIAKQLGLPIKGINPQLDGKVLQELAKITGYKAHEIKAKVDAYKATGKKLSALKKKVMKNSGDPTQAPTTQTVKKAVAEVKKEPIENLHIIYADKEVASQYIIAKDQVVAASNGKWTLYTKSPQLDKAIYDKVREALAGITDQEIRSQTAKFIATGKKLSQLKKELIKSGKLKPEADTLKSKGAKTAKEKPAPEAPPEIPRPSLPQPPAGVPELMEFEEEIVYNSVKSLGSFFADSNPQNLYEKLVKAMEVFRNPNNPAHHVFNKFRENDLLSLLKVIDSHGARKFSIKNAHIFEKKLTDWVQSGEGKQYILNKKRVQELIKSQPDLPPDSGLFKILSTDDALGTPMDAQNLSRSVQAALKTYTTSSYREINGHLRHGSQVMSGTRTTIEKARQGMVLFDRDVLLHRGTGLSQFGVQTRQELYNLIGKTITDKGFGSSSVGGRAAFGGEVLMEIQAPKGVARGAYVDVISAHRGEHEMLLNAGTKYKILRVEDIGEKIKVICRIVF